MLRHIIHVRLHGVFQRNRFIAEEAGIHLHQHRGGMIGCTPHHRAIDMGKMRFGLVEVLDAAVEHDCELGVLALHAIDEFVIQRRHVAIFPGRQSFEPGLARMHGKYFNAGTRA